MTENCIHDHIFISYATEDADFAEWLALKLTSEGYCVWCDRFKLLGGESYPIHIDDAIKNHTFIFLALLSHSSISKPNPLKERTLALNIAQARKEEFVIPLNVSGLSASEIDWMTSDLTFIPFHKSWALGLNQLLKKLSSINAPKPLENGKAIAAETFFHTELINNNPETLYTNVLRILKIPDTIKLFRFDNTISDNEKEVLSQRWAFYTKNPRTVLAFQSPPKIVSDTFSLNYSGEAKWRNLNFIDGISTNNLVSNLLRRSIDIMCCQKGLRKTENGDLYFPYGIFKENKLHFCDYKGRRTRVLVAGERHRSVLGKQPETYLYYLSPRLIVRKDTSEEYLVHLVIYLYLTNEAGEPLSSKSAASRRKKIRKNWWNHELLNRNLAVASFLADGSETIKIGDLPDEQILISANFIQCEVHGGINEDLTKAETINDDIPVSFDDEYPEDCLDGGIK